MTYAVKRENVFAMQDPRYPDCTPPRIKRSDHRLKKYPSIYDDRTWELSRERQYRALYELISDSKTCLMGGDACHKYVPLEDLIRILMSEKDALIKQLEDELRRCCKHQGDQASNDEINNSREMLRKAMHKLQNIDEIVNENKTLQCRLRCSEEKIKYLEEKRKSLENEIEDLRSRSQIQVDLERAQQKLEEMTQKKGGPCWAGRDTLASERDQLKKKVKELEKELEMSKKKEEEVVKLRESLKGFEDKDEITMENECYRKKLASMRCLEKQIQELKKHGRALADKYKREAQKAAEQMNRMSQASKELQALQKERDSLQKRVKELSSYESQYNALQCKLRNVEEVIIENEILNSKLVALEKLEKENEYLKCRLNRIQEMENTAAEDKERIMQLQCAVADQEEEMKDLLCQIERLTSGTHQEELERLRCELHEKNSKLKLCEEQLAEIPMLEAEIDELRTKLQTCCREFPEQKTGKCRSQKIEVRLPAVTTGICAKYKLQGQKSSLIHSKCEEKLGSKTKLDDCEKKILGKQKAALSEPCQSDKMTCEEVQSLLQSSKGIISCVLEDMMEHQKEMEELEKRNKAMKDEIEMLKAKIETHVAASQEVNDLKKALEEANKEICLLQKSGGSGSSEDVELLRDLNSQMKAELQAACEGLKQVSALEKKLEEEHRARCRAEQQLRRRGESGIVEPKNSNLDLCKALQKEVDDLKLQIIELNKLTDELKKENNMLRELQKPCPDFSKEMEEKCALENLLSLLQAELDAFKGQKLSDECEALRKELKRVMEQNCQLKALVDCYRQRLDLEKKSKELGEEILPEEERSVDGKSTKTTPSKSATPTSETATPLARTPSKSATLTPETDTPIKSATLTPETATPVARTPIKSATPTPDTATPLAKTPSKSAVATPETVTPLAKTPSKSSVVPPQSPTPLAKTPSKSSVAPPKSPTPVAKTPSKSSVAPPKSPTPPQPSKSVTKVPSGRVAFTPDTVDKKTDPSPSEDTVKQEPKVKSSPPPKDERVEPKAPPPPPAITSKTAATQTEVKTRDVEVTAKEEPPMVKEKEPPAVKEKEQVKPKDKSAEDELQALKARLKQMEEENAQKLKALMDQHEKELAHRDKVCNDNLNAMKAGYETDIRKLAERHKQGVMQLQGLHEDEVNELNTTYETQMEIMQTQSEAALNEVVKGSSDRLKKLAEQHAKELENKDKELKKLQDGLSQSQRQLETLKKKAEDPIDVKDLKAKHSRELNAMKRGSQRKLSILKDKFDEEKKKSDSEIENLKKKIKGAVCDCKSKRKDRKSKDPCAPLDFIDVVEKILSQGLQALSFNEIALVHRKACCALEEMVMNSDVTPTLEPAVRDSCPHVPLIEADRQQLLKRIFTLENAIQEKQRRTQETIINMEVAIKRERCRLMELKNMLINEQRKNSELKIVIQSQSQIQTNLKKERDDLGNKASLHESLFEEKSKQLDQEKQDKKFLEEEVERLKMKLKQLCFALEMARGGPECQQNDQIEMLRIKLEQAQNQERKLAYQLQEEAKCRLQLQCQVQALRQSFKQMVSLPAMESPIRIPQNPSDAKTAKDMKNLNQLKNKKNKSKPSKKHKK